MLCVCVVSDAASSVSIFLPVCALISLVRSSSVVQASAVLLAAREPWIAVNLAGEALAGGRVQPPLDPARPIQILERQGACELLLVERAAADEEVGRRQRGETETEESVVS